MVPTSLVLSEAQRKSIETTSGVWVRKENKRIRALKSYDNQWLIYDQVIGKHENIDIAVGITNQGSVKAVEVLIYRESYGCEVLQPKWLQQFIEKRSSNKIKIDHDIVNISGATMSCVHITDGVNRLVHTWDQVLRTA
jgi:Na+-translocating ferredoxin:NAD+ oxidoreductase RnfG subunit